MGGALFKVRFGTGHLDGPSTALSGAVQTSGRARTAFCVVAEENKVGAAFSAPAARPREDKGSIPYCRYPVRRARFGDP